MYRFIIQLQDQLQLHRRSKTAVMRLHSAMMISIPMGDLYEGFCIYRWDTLEDDFDGEHVILQGATKLPLDDLELFANVFEWWLDCLTELKDTLPDAQWHVNLDDLDFDWSEEEHRFLPHRDE